MKKTLFGMTQGALRELAAERGYPSYVGNQLAEWIYARSAGSFGAMTNLAREVREELDRDYDLSVSAPARVSVSRDGTKKYLFPVGERYVEAAYIPEKRRNTLCLSTQVGCKMGCLFCMTGKQGFQGNLTPGEIVSQFAGLPERDSVSHIVYMGMGEPFDNLEAVLRSLDILTARWGFGISPRRITVSTIGVLPAMRRFLEETSAHLAISLHSPFGEERKRIMPIEHVYPLSEVLDLLKVTELAGRRRVSFEYIMFEGVNDSPIHARELVRILHGIKCRVNLIYFHPIPATPLRPSPAERMAAFRDRLNESGITATIRRSRGQDIQAACGLLSTKALLAPQPADY